LREAIGFLPIAFFIWLVKFSRQSAKADFVDDFQFRVGTVLTVG
jgi:hypothetical protein